MADVSWRIKESASEFEVVTEKALRFSREEKKELLAKLLINLEAFSCELDLFADENNALGVVLKQH